MKKAADSYEQKSEEFARSAEEIKPAAPVEAAVEERAAELERRYIVCPKCGEKIWL